MTNDPVVDVLPDPTRAAAKPAAPPPVGPASCLDLWARAQQMNRCFGEDDGEPHIMRGLD
ncbi:hypothetical protein [Micromonospora radicis]|uniref:Uncharacterized protein n=1 Tax=Micromonospora radicis TaxID=1894971 RepID=A0A418MYU6_9ACTN|nr:hypothetical protein [Micromonospora radicis]RIV40273.1 hypothetical protein D2L64_05350 [Micromonospora radicis]